MSQKMIIFVLLIDHQVWIHYSGDTRSHCLVGVLRRVARTGDSDTAAPAPAMSRMNKSSLGQFIKSKYISVFVRAWAIWSGPLPHFMTHFLNYFCILETFAKYCSKGGYYSMSCMAHIHLKTIMKTLSNVITYLVMNSCHTYRLSEHGFSQLFAPPLFCLDLMMIFLSNCFVINKILWDCATHGRCDRPAHLAEDNWRWPEVGGGPTLWGETNSGSGGTGGAGAGAAAVLFCLRSPLRVAVKALRAGPAWSPELRPEHSTLRSLSRAPGPMFGSLVTISMEMLHCT